METKPDTIRVSALHREEIYASHADLFVTVRGSSVVSGNEAMKKAREVSQLADELTRFGIPSEDVHLQGVHVETSSGAILKSSSATYHLRIRCEKLDHIPDLLDIISSQKNATLERIDWKYPEEAGNEQALQSAMVKAKTRADKVAAALGVKLLGVYDFTENTMDQEPPRAMFAAQAAPKARGMEMAAEPSLGMDIQHSKIVQVNVEIWYRVSSL